MPARLTAVGMPPEWIEAMEVYHGIGTPIEYGGCGVILIWTNNR